jgi:hypothetical protein
MMRFHRGIAALGLVGAIALVSCGGDEEGDGGPRGGTSGAGAAGASGDGGASSGRGGEGAGGRGGASTSGGEAGEGASTSGGSSAGGEAGSDAGAGGFGEEGTPLTVADEETKTIAADEGGTLTLGRLSLEIPPGALAEDTELTIKSFDESEGLFVLEPDGLTFEEPIRAHYTFPANAEAGKLLIALAATAELGELAELVTDGAIERANDDEYRVTIDLAHFSFLTFFETGGYAVDQELIFLKEDLANEDLGDISVGVEFGIVHAYSAAGDTDFVFIPEEDEGYHAPFIFDFHVTSTTLHSTSVAIYASQPVPVPEGTQAVPGAPVVLGATPVMTTRLFECAAAERGSVGVREDIRFQANIEWTRFTMVEDPRTHEYYQYTHGRGEDRNATLRPFLDEGDNESEQHDLDCVPGPSVIGTFASQAISAALRVRFKDAWTQYCYDLSNDEACKAPNPDHAIINVLDPLLQVGQNAAARLEAAFPCGAGALGTTLCGTSGPFAPGDYVFVLATFGADIPADDPVGMYQHAFVFDADGIVSNNYEPPAQYPKDFFQGTDKWYQVFYAPADGFSIKVVDARLSTSNPVASGARMIVAGREFAAFIPRAELDGAEPSFRVTTFRHEGDYGLQGGSWDASYYPPLGEPLMPAAAGDPLVLPED